MPIIVRTNNVPRELVPLASCPPDVIADFDYIEGDEQWSDRMFQYRGIWYDAHEFLSPTHEGGFSSALPIGHPIREWDGYQSDSYFSGVAIRFPSCGQWGTDHSRVVAATFLLTSD